MGGNNDVVSDPPPAAEATISLAVADGHPLYVNGIVDAIRTAPNITLVGTATDGPMTVELIIEKRPRVAVIDADLPRRDGLEVVRILRQRAIPTAVIMLTDRQDGETVLAALIAGAAGVIAKTTAVSGLICAIEQAATGRSILPGEIGPLLAATLRRHGDGQHAQLTARESEILRAIARGESAAVISDRLHLALPTVKTHLQNLYAKLGAHDRGSAVATAIRRGLID